MIGLRSDEQRQEQQAERRRASNAAAAALRARLGLALRHKPGPMPRVEAKAFARVVERSELAPWELVDELLGALLDAHPEASIVEAASWLAGLEKEAGYHYGTGEKVNSAARVYSEQGAIIGGSGLGATGIAPGPARNEGGSDR